MLGPKINIQIIEGPNHNMTNYICPTVLVC